MAKSAPKTMRFEDWAEDYINKFDGDNFSERFHAMVHFFIRKEDEIRIKINHLNDSVAEKEKRFRILNDYLFKTMHLENQFRSLDRELQGVRSYLEHFAIADLERVRKV